MDSTLQVRNFGLQLTNRKMKSSKFIQSIDTLSNKSTVIILGIVAHLVFLLMMVFTFPVINEAIGGPAFDLRTFGYSLADANMIVGNLTSETRDLYVFAQLGLLDVLYPVLLACFLATLLNRLLRVNSKQQQFWYLLLVPFIGMLFDYAENVMVFMMIQDHIALNSLVVGISSLFTQLKGGFTMITWACVLWQTGVWIIGKARGKALQFS